MGATRRLTTDWRNETGRDSIYSRSAPTDLIAFTWPYRTVVVVVVVAAVVLVLCRLVEKR